jgi:hypothetical protein
MLAVLAASCITNHAGNDCQRLNMQYKLVWLTRIDYYYYNMQYRQWSAVSSAQQLWKWQHLACKATKQRKLYMLHTRKAFTRLLQVLLRTSSRRQEVLVCAAAHLMCMSL